MRGVALIAVALALAGCLEDEAPEIERLGGFALPAPGDGELQLLAPIVRGIAPGDDVVVCSYLPLRLSPDYPAAIARVAALQSAPGGHGAELVALDDEHRLGNAACDDAALVAGQVIAAGSTLPADTPLLVRSRWVNRGAGPLDGQAGFVLTLAPP